jgi:uridine kinase
VPTKVPNPWAKNHGRVIATCIEMTMDPTTTTADSGEMMTTPAEEGGEEERGGGADRTIVVEEEPTSAASPIEVVVEDVQLPLRKQHTSSGGGSTTTANSPAAVMYTIGIAGGSGAGKTTLAKKIYDALGGASNVCYLVHDSYYRDQSTKSYEERCQTNFDHPDALETNLLLSHIQTLKSGQSVSVPTYDFTTHTRKCAEHWTIASPKPILLLEGILLLHETLLVAEMDLKVFVDAEADVRFIRRLLRDCTERGRSMPDVVAQYQATVRPMHDRYVAPSCCVADLVVHADAHGTDNFDVPCAVLTNHLRAVVVSAAAPPVPTLPLAGSAQTAGDNGSTKKDGPKESS